MQYFVSLFLDQPEAEINKFMNAYNINGYSDLLTFLNNPDNFCIILNNI